MLVRGLRHRRSDQVVGNHMRPDFLANKLWSFASQAFHIHLCFDGAQIEFVVPSLKVQFREILFGVQNGIQEGRHDDDLFGSEPRLRDIDFAFSNHQILRHRLLSLTINTAYPRLGPWHNVIVFS